jgi:hypothetical protein
MPQLLGAFQGRRVLHVVEGSGPGYYSWIVSGCAVAVFE